MSNNQDYTVADTLLSQIGAVSMCMLGAKFVKREESGVSFKIGRNSKSVSHLSIQLDHGTDTYTVKATRQRWSSKLGEYSVKTVAEADLVYVDNLHDVLEDVTGLYTRFRRGR